MGDSRVFLRLGELGFHLKILLQKKISLELDVHELPLKLVNFTLEIVFELEEFQTSLFFRVSGGFLFGFKELFKLAILFFEIFHLLL